MKLILAIIGDSIIREVIDALNNEGLPYTKLTSTGVFFKKGNTTLLIGTEEKQVDSILALIRETIETSENHKEVEGQADGNIFVLPVLGRRKV